MCAATIPPPRRENIDSIARSAAVNAEKEVIQILQDQADIAMQPVQADPSAPRPAKNHPVPADASFSRPHNIPESSLNHFFLRKGEGPFSYTNELNNIH